MSGKLLNERFELRLGTAALESVDAWRIQQEDVPSRAEAIRRLIDAGLVATGVAKQEVRLSPGEKMILLLLCDLSKRMKTASEEIDYSFMEAAINGGHTWALGAQFSHVFHTADDRRETIDEVADILGMWVEIEASLTQLSKKDKARLGAACRPFSAAVRFEGFDANNEEQHFHVADFMVNQLDRFPQFKERKLNSHAQTLDTYRRMLGVYREVRSTSILGSLSADDLIAIIRAMVHPENRRPVKYEVQ